MYTVIISSMGRWSYLNELFISLSDQTLNPSEVILLLDGSESVPYLVSHLEYPMLNVPIGLNLIIYEVNANLPRKRNLGVSLTSNSKILFSDDDDIWDSNKAEVVVDYLNDYDLVTHNFNKFGSVSRNSCSKLGSVDKTITHKNLLSGDNVFGGGSSISATKEVLTLYPFDENFSYCEDFEWWFRVLSNVHLKCIYSRQPLVSYRVHDENMTSKYYKIYRGLFNLVVKHLKINFVIFISLINVFCKSTFKMILKLLRSKLC